MAGKAGFEQRRAGRFAVFELSKPPATRRGICFRVLHHKLNIRGGSGHERLGTAKGFVVLPGRNEARTGLRMMPTFPRSPLKFRKAGFTRYGFKAGRSGGTFPSTRGLRIVQFVSALRALRFPAPSPRSESRGAVRWYTSVQAALAALPQGPSLRSGL